MSTACCKLVPTTLTKQCEHSLSTACEQIFYNLFADLIHLDECAFLSVSLTSPKICNMRIYHRRINPPSRCQEPHRIRAAAANLAFLLETNTSRWPKRRDQSRFQFLSSRRPSARRQNRSRRSWVTKDLGIKYPGSLKLSRNERAAVYCQCLIESWKLRQDARK